MKNRDRRKRYLLMSADSEVGTTEQREFVRIILQRYPGLDPKKMVWVGNSLILRTDHRTLPEMKLGLVVRAGGITMVPRRASGSISKLKRAAEPPTERKWS